MKILHLIAQTLWLTFLVYFLLERNNIKQMLGGYFWMAAVVIFIVTLALFIKRPRE